MKKNEDKHTPLSLSLYDGREPEDLLVPNGALAAVRLGIETALAYEDISGPCEVSLTLCDGPYIRTLNAAYRDKDSATDVLSFPLFEEDEECLGADEILPLGDIVINVDRAAEQARELGHSTLREMAFLAVHSTLHLLGYDHERGAEEEEEMCRRQREIISKIEKNIEAIEAKE